MADVANMETSMNIERGGSGKDNSGWKRLSQAKRLVEMNLRYVRYWCWCGVGWGYLVLYADWRVA
jgi:hypothetical protein